MALQSRRVTRQDHETEELEIELQGRAPPPLYRRPILDKALIKRIGKAPWPPTYCTKINSICDQLEHAKLATIFTSQCNTLTTLMPCINTALSAKARSRSERIDHLERRGLGTNPWGSAIHRGVDGRPLHTVPVIIIVASKQQVDQVAATLRGGDLALKISTDEMHICEDTADILVCRYTYAQCPLWCDRFWVSVLNTFELIQFDGAHEMFGPDHRVCQLTRQPFGFREAIAHVKNLQKSMLVPRINLTAPREYASSVATIRDEVLPVELGRFRHQWH